MSARSRYGWAPTRSPSTRGSRATSARAVTAFAESPYTRSARSWADRPAGCSASTTSSSAWRAVTGSRRPARRTGLLGGLATPPADGGVGPERVDPQPAARRAGLDEQDRPDDPRAVGHGLEDGLPSGSTALVPPGRSSRAPSHPRGVEGRSGATRAGRPVAPVRGPGAFAVRSPLDAGGYLPARRAR